jgi:yjcQ protein
MTKAFKTIYTLLNRLEKALDYEKEDFNAEEQIGYKALGITEIRWQNYIEMLNQAGYISGVTTKRFIDGSSYLDISAIRITLQGLQYLAENTMMMRVFNTLKETKSFF